ncbi:acyl carrier protein, partial [Streptomyces beijiangensis]
MTSEPLTDVLDAVTRELAAVLRVEPDRIAPHQRFQALGLDSIRTAELMAAVNARFGTGIVADALYGHDAGA